MPDQLGSTLARTAFSRARRIHYLESWPGLSRPSTSFALKAARKPWMPTTSAGMTAKSGSISSEYALVTAGLVPTMAIVRRHPDRDRRDKPGDDARSFAAVTIRNYN